MQSIVNSFDGEDVHLYVVWLPAIWSDSRDAAVERTAEYSDNRASHYWDETKVTGRWWQSLLQLPTSAWDVYFLYGPDQAWKDDVPAPQFWMHQLRDVSQAPLYDRVKFEEQVKAAVAKLNAEK